MRSIVVRSAALAALAAGSAQVPAIAQVQSGSGFFGFVSGGYLFDEGPGPRATSISGPAAGPVGLAPRPTAISGGGFSKKAKPGDGFALDGKFGYAFGGGWDVAAGGAYSMTYDGKSVSLGSVVPFRLTEARFGNVDAEVGYTIKGPGFGVRPALGIRYLRAIQESMAGPISVGGVSLTADDRTRAWGIGPQASVDAAVGITNSLSIVGGLETAFLYGKVRNTITASASAGDVSASASATTRDTRLIWQLGGRLGLDWEVAPLVHIVAGYRVNYTDGATYSTLVGNDISATGRGSILEHGPFVRLTYNWGAGPTQ